MSAVPPVQPEPVASLVSVDRTVKPDVQVRPARPEALAALENRASEDPVDLLANPAPREHEENPAQPEALANQEGKASKARVVPPAPQVLVDHVVPPERAEHADSLAVTVRRVHLGREVRLAGLERADVKVNRDAQDPKVRLVLTDRKESVARTDALERADNEAKLVKPDRLVNPVSMESVAPLVPLVL